MGRITLKIIQVGDIVQWSRKGELELSPKYQRNSVWNDKAKSYLIDTILRGLPIPPVFMRQKIDVNTKSTFREIIDGQQRIRAILEFVADEKFAVKKSHNKEYGGKKYSDLDEETQEAVLGYEITAEVVAEKNESLIYDMFARFNSNNYVLNRQEIRNSKYWGDFKVLVYSLASEYRSFFLEYKMLSDRDLTRMKDAELVNSMIILLSEGIVSEKPSSVDKIYDKYDAYFDEDGEIERRFARIMSVIGMVYSYFNGNLACLANKNYFFTFYSVIANQMYGIKDGQMERNVLFSEENIESSIDRIYEICAAFLNDYAKQSYIPSDRAWAEFIRRHKAKTTDRRERADRIAFMNSYFA